MGFFDDLKKEISQAVTELVSDEELLKEDVYDTEMENMTSKTVKAVKTADTDYLDEDDYIETEEDYAEDIQPSKVVVDDLASDEYVNTMNIDIKDLIASYSNELSGNMETKSSNEDYEETYNNPYESSYDNQYDSQYAVDEPMNTPYMDGASQNEEAAETMEAMNTLGFANELAQMYGDDDDIMVNTLDDEVFGEPMIQEPEQQKESVAEEPQIVESIEEPEIVESTQEPEVEDWVTEEPLPDDFEEENPVADEIVSKEPIMEEELLENFNEPVMEEPVMAEISEEKEEPEVKEKPARAKAAVKAKPIAVEEPVVTEEPVAKAKTAKEKPAVKEKSVKAKAAVKAKPVVMEEPVAVEEPVVIKKPAETKPEVVIEEPVEEEPVIIVKTQPEEKKVKKEVNEVMEEQEEILTPAFEQDMPNERDILQDMADYSDETTVITKGVIVKGDIISGGSINVLGEVEGNITCKGKLMVCGTVQGNAEAGELFANEAHITGNIVNGGSVKIGQGSVIIGNVTGSSAVIAGAVKGDIDVNGPVIIDSTAIIMGDIKSKSVQINNGAAIEGRCSQCYADVNPTTFFKEN